LLVEHPSLAPQYFACSGNIRFRAKMRKEQAKVSAARSALSNRYVVSRTYSRFCDQIGAAKGLPKFFIE
jgi:hypothetical protein